MRVKILSSTSTFNGVSYNTNKAEKGKGELMKKENFGYLQSSNIASPSEVKDFLKAHSNRNTRVKNKQFHAMISCSGKEFNKEELTKIGDEWIREMGYDKNPYIIVFHSDTANNHIHIVSSRIGKDGKKIDDSNERIRAQASINKIMQLDQKNIVENVLRKGASMNFSSMNQIKLFFERSGYGLKEENGALKLFKFGLYQGELNLKDINKIISSYKLDDKRSKQIKAIFTKYQDVYNPSIEPVYRKMKDGSNGKHIAYRSDLTDFLKEKFGMEIIFHGKDEKKPYGYTVLDHSTNNIFKGGEIMPLEKLIAKKVEKVNNKTNYKVFVSGPQEREAFGKIKNDPERFVFSVVKNNSYRMLSVPLRSIIYDFNSIQEGLDFFKFDLNAHNNQLFLHDKTNGHFVAVNKLLDNRDYNLLAQYSGVETLGEAIDKIPDAHTISNEDRMGDGNELGRELSFHPENDINFQLSISDDIDDEQINGRNRKRKKKARTNTR